jgi:two-component system CheB/CheR fusion protein
MKAKKDMLKIGDATPLPSKEKHLKSSNLFPVVGIGASAGGLDAFKKLLKAIPDDSGMAYVLVQHLDPTHESMLPELLQKVTKIPVLEIADDIKVLPNHIYVIPSNKMMVATDGVLQLSPRPKTSKTERNLPIDLFFTSLAEVHREHAIGVVLSGTATDGTLGLKAIKDQGGITFAQDEASAAYGSMPQNAAAAGVVDYILPPEMIPQKLLEVIGTGHGDGQLPLEAEAVYKQIISLLRIRKGTDFTYYKQSTIHRRILRRMGLSKNETPADYLQFLKENKPEQDLLFLDLLIPVTSFFRDEKSFENLYENVFLQAAKNKTSGEPIRVWVAGCSTGEEAYSIAICLKEHFGDNQRLVQIFATDISDPAIAKARRGIYKKSELNAVSPERLHVFFTKTNGGYQVNKSVRNMCVFAVHNFLKDPPFGKMDFISCRNVLIYMEPYLQKKALTTFHYALNPKGFLLLGKSETTSGVPDLFVAAIKNDKLFSRKDTPGSFVHVASQRVEQHFSNTKANHNSEQVRTDFQKTADDILLRKYTPAGVVVNEALDIVHFRGNTSSYLEQSAGKPTHNLIQLAKNGLAFELRNILHKIKKEIAPVLKENIPIEINGSLRYINIEGIPLPNTIEPYYLVLFHDTTSSAHPALAVSEFTSSNITKDDRDLRIKQLEQELAQTREDMHSITEEQEAANEELQSANEELLSGSEELQSLNEELETGKEELQSTNEELTVVNQEMISLNELVTASRDYAEAIIINLREPLLVLDKNLRIKTANNAFYKTFRVNENETEGVLIYDIGNKQWDIPDLRTLLEKILPEKSVFNGFEVTHTFSSIGKRVMLLNAREIINKNSSEKLILLSIEDVTEQVNQRNKIEESEKRFRLMAELIPQKIWTADAEGNKNYFNQNFMEFSGLGFEELKGWGWGKLVHPDEWAETKKLWQRSIDTGTDFQIESRLLGKDGQYLWHLTRATALKGGDGKVKMWVGSKTEIQEQKEQKDELEKAVLSRTTELQEANKELEEKHQELLLTKEKLLTEYSRSLIEASLDPLITINADGKITDMNKAFASITEVPHETLIGTDFSLYFTDPQKAREIQEEVFSKGFVTNYPLTIIDGEPTAVLFNGSVYKDENKKVLGAVLVARDITEQQKFETELIEAKVFAEMAMGTAEDEKNKALVAAHIAEDAVKSKQQFLSNMSHEIRTPMNAIIGFTKVMLKTELTAKQKEYLSAIKMSGDALIVLINDILDLAKVDAGKMTFEQTRFKMSQSIAAMLHLFEAKIQEKNLELVREYDPNIPETLVGDPVRLHQIIMNLVSNAVKFTAKGRITVSVRLLKEDEESATIEFSVADTGIGIMAGKLEKIFENFQQASSATARLFGGTGLGLAISKKLVEQQGGEIWVKSVVDEGAVFSFSLTFKKTADNSELDPISMEQETDPISIKVLVVEDMALNQLLMKTLLDDFGFVRDIADNGRIAIEKLENNSYDIILMDLHMPEMNGFEATEHIRNELHSKIPIIALTADVTTVDLEKCMAVGMNDYIAKPVDERLLYSKIVSLVKKPNPIVMEKTTAPEPIKKLKYTDLDYLTRRTKNNPELILEMISAYLEQTPPLISAMKQSAQNKDWDLLYATVHKMIPSFSIMGISNDFESMAKKVQDYARTQQQADTIIDMVLQLENVCVQACRELEEEFNRIKNIQI